MKIPVILISFLAASSLLGGTMELDTNYFEVPPTVKVKPTKAGITNLFGFDGSTNKFLSADGTIRTPSGSGGGTVGTLITNGAAVSAGDLVAYGASLTNTAKATSANVQAALGSAYRTLWIAAGAMVPSSTNGASPGTWRQIGSDDYVKDVFDFNDTTSQSTEFTISLPSTWDNGTVTLKLYWVSQSATTGTNVWSVAAGAVSAGDALGAILGTAATATNAVQNATNKLNVVATTALTVGGTPAADDMLLFKVSRLPGDAYDTTTGDARLLGVKLQYLDTIYGGSAW